MARSVFGIPMVYWRETASNCQLVPQAATTAAM